MFWKKRIKKFLKKSIDRTNERAYTNEVVSSEAADTAETLK